MVWVSLSSFRKASRNVGRWRRDRLSSQRLLSVTPGSGMQERFAVPAVHGKTESKLATGSCAANLIEAATLPFFHFTDISQIFRASDGAPYPKSSSWVPTIGA